jgi:hypothetical protein
VHCCADDRPDAAEYVPRGQLEQPTEALVAPEIVPNVPAGHALHAVDPPETANVPMAHGTHADVPLVTDTRVPAGHDEHAAADAAPWAVLAEPGGQALHCVAPVVAAYEPAAHGVHDALDVAPVASENVPAGHGVHWASDVAFSAAPYVPAGQRKQLPLEVAPLDGLYVPRGHATQSSSCVLAPADELLLLLLLP